MISNQLRFLSFVFYFAVVSCSSAKSIIVDSCTSEGVPEPICTCTYKGLSEKYSDGEIKEYHTEIEAIEKSGKEENIAFLSAANKQFVMDYYDAAGKCLQF